MKLAIVGSGFVGSAVQYGFNSLKSKDVLIIDPKLGTKVEDLKGKKIDFAFICVPTPMGADGVIDASILISCVEYIKANVDCTIIIKSTVVPEILTKLTANTKNVVYNPEFLTEANAKNDFINPFMHVFGGEKEYTDQVEQLYINHSSCKPCVSYHVSVQEASMIKYGINCFLASKVLWFNQFLDVVESEGLNFSKIVNAITTDSRVGASHTNVPGQDGKRGFGSACFAKDTLAFIKQYPSFTVLKEVINRNNEYRLQYELDDREKEQHVRFDYKLD